MKTTTNNNQTRALMVIDQTAARIEAAHRRHQTTTPAVIPLFAICESALLDTAHRRTRNSLRRMSKSGNPVTMRLQAKEANDRKLDRYGEYWEEADSRRAEHDQRRAEKADLDKIAKRISTPEEQRDIATDEAAALADEAAAALAEAQDIERAAHALTHSDRADLVQTAAIELLLHGQHSRAASAAVNREVRRAANKSGYIQSRTEVMRPATAADLNNHPTHVDKDGKHIFEPLPYITRKGVQDGFLHIEHRAAAKLKDGTERPEGLYMIHRRKTAAEYVSFESIVEEGRDFEDTNNGINIIQTQTDCTEIEALADRAKLSETERKALLYVLDNITAARVLRAADENGETTESLCRRLWREALRRAGVADEAAQPTAEAKIKDKLRAAEGDKIEALNERDKKRLQRLQKKLRAAKAEQEAATRAAEEARAAATMFSQTISRTISRTEDTRTEAERAAAREYAAQGITWKESGEKPQTVTETARQKAARIVQEQTKHPHRMTAADYGALWAIAEHVAHALQTLPNEERRAAVLWTKAAEAEAAAQTAQAIADSYPRRRFITDPADSPEAITARQKAAQLATIAEQARRRAAEQAQTVSECRAMIDQYSRRRFDF